VALVNLDPANDSLPYAPDVDVRELVDLQAVQEALGLGPNGGLLYALDYVAANADWLADALAPHAAANAYFVFDCPGQVELFTHSGGFKALVDALTGTKTSSSSSGGGGSGDGSGGVSGSSGSGSRAAPAAAVVVPPLRLDLRLAGVHLVDAHLATEPAK
jgi:hypothetical protein